MPQATDLVVQNGAATPVNKTFSLVNPAGGPSMTAEWQLKEGAIAAVFPTLTNSSNRNRQNRSRKGQTKLVYPSTKFDSLGNAVGRGPTAEFYGTVVIPDDFPEDQKPHFAAYIKNIIATALFTGANGLMRDGTPAT